MTETRIETDSMGEVHVPAKAYYSAQTQRAIENFPVSGWTLHPELIRAMGWVKYACGVANRDLGKLTHSGKKQADRPASAVHARRGTGSGPWEMGWRIPD